MTSTTAAELCVGTGLAVASASPPSTRARHQERSAERPFRLRLLDGFELSCEGEIVRLPLVAQHLVAFLALEMQARERVYVAGKLWFETTEGHAYACLRSVLWRLRKCGVAV